MVEDGFVGFRVEEDRFPRGDFNAVSLATVRFAPLQTEQTLIVEVIGETVFENLEAFLVKWVRVVGAQVIDTEAAH